MNTNLFKTLFWIAVALILVIVSVTITASIFKNAEHQKEIANLEEQHKLELELNNYFKSVNDALTNIKDLLPSVKEELSENKKEREEAKTSLYEAIQNLINADNDRYDTFVTMYNAWARLVGYKPITR